MAAESSQPLSVFIGCPGDMAPERDLLLKLEKKLARRGYPVKFLVWPDVPPSAGRPQEVIFNHYPVETWDIFVGLLWNRFGSPAGEKDKHGKMMTGTEEEFKRAYAEWKASGHKRPHIAIYRCVRPDVTKGKGAQIAAVEAFFDEFGAEKEYEALYTDFDDPSDFKDQVEEHLVTIIEKIRAEREADASSKTKAALAREKPADSVVTEEPEHSAEERPGSEPPAESGNPYRELSYYKVEDDHFYGRRDFVDHVIGRLEARLADPHAVAACRLIGQSGAGKSSVLRAGILRKLGERHGEYRWAVLRPELFKDSAGVDLDVIQTVLEEIEVQAQVEIPAPERRAIGRASANAPAEAAQAVIAEFKRNTSGAGRLVLALDQFEEIVDELGSAQRRAYWQPLLRFIETAFRHPEFGMIYTLESSRAGQHARLNLPQPFLNAFAEELDDFTRWNVKAIIGEPFEKTGYPLAEDVIAELEREFIRLRNRGEGVARNSVLPLLSLKLHALWDFVAANLEPIGTIGGAEFVSEDKRITKHKLERFGQTLDLASVIGELAKKAWHRAGADEVDDEKLGYFLRPFVGVEGEHLQLLAVPRQAAYEDEQNLVDSFSKHRLLVGVGDGLVQFVHQAVFDHWKDAAKWLSGNRAFLKRVAAMRIAAQEWENKGRPKIASRGKKLEENIAIAAEILSNYHRAWSFEDAKVHGPDRQLKDYCLGVFEKSKTPRQHLVLEPEPAGSHVNLAASYGMTELVKRFGRIDKSCLHDLASKKKDASRPLNTAAWSHLSTVQYLLGRGVSPFETNGDGWPPVAAAIRRGRLDIFHALMKAAATRCTGEALEAGLICPQQRTLVHLAAFFDRADMLRELIGQYGFFAGRRDGSGELPIHDAAAQGALATFDLLCERDQIGALVEKTEWTCLHLAAIWGKEAIVDRILRSPAASELLAHEDHSGLTALHHAARGHHSECITALLKRGLDPNRKSRNGDMALHLTLRVAPNGRRPAGSENYDEEKAVTALRALLDDKRTDPNAEDGSGERPASLIDHNRRLLRELLKDPRIALRQPIRKGGDMGIFLAARENIWGAVQRFIAKNGFPVGTERDSEENTLLHHLTTRSAPPELLFDKIGEITKDQLNARDKRGRTPFHRALVAQNWLLAERMFETGLVDLHESSDALNWELWMALRSDAEETLLKKLAAALGARVAEPDSDGWTLLHHVAATNYAKWTEALAKSLPLEELWSIPDRLGRRPIDLGGESISALVPEGVNSSPWPEPIAWDRGANWEVAPKTEAQVFTTRVNLAGVDTDGWELARGTLPFYPDTFIARLTSVGNGGLSPVYYWLDDGENLRRLDGISLPIHEFNAKHLKLTPDCVRNYLHFFCFFVRGKEGPFFVLEHASLATLSAGTTHGDRAKIGNLAMPAWLIRERDDYFRLLARIFYGDTLFVAYFRVLRTGIIEMEEDIPVLADLSGRIDMPIG